MAVAARKDWFDRAIASVTPEEVAAQTRLATLALAPVQKPRSYAPLDLAGPVRIIKVAREWSDVVSPAEAWETHKNLATIIDEPSKGEIRGTDGNDRAAMRAQLQGIGSASLKGDVEALGEHGAIVLMAVLLEVGELEFQTVVVEGTYAAVLAAYPDRDTVKAWKAAGAIDVAVVEAEGETLRVRRVPIDEVPKVVQMERLSRSLGEL